MQSLDPIAETDLLGTITSLLASTYDVNEHKNKQLSVSEGTVCAFISVHPSEQAGNLVEIRIPLAIDVPVTLELLEHITTNADRYWFGHLSCAPVTDGVTSVFLSHRLLGDHLQAPELLGCVDLMLNTADQLDGLLVKRFGGHGFTE